MGGFSHRTKVKSTHRSFISTQAMLDVKLNKIHSSHGL
jgi:hypothetical protein